MAQLKWFIWIALIVIIIKMYDKTNLPSGNKVKTKDEVVAPDSSSILQADTVGAEEKLLAEAHESLFQYFRSHYDSVQSDSFVYVFGNSNGKVEMRVRFGPIISPSERHLAVNSNMSGRNESMIVNAATMQVLETISTDDINPFLKDINNDGNKDLIFHEGAKAAVRIYNIETGQFNKAIELEGACFSPSERLVRGKFSDGPVYFKYRWEGPELKPVEFLYPHPDNANWLIRSDSLFQDQSQASGSTLWFLPKEYRNVEACAADGGI